MAPAILQGRPTIQDQLSRLKAELQRVKTTDYPPACEDAKNAVLVELGRRAAILTGRRGECL